jgi:regulator of sigma E protease
MGGLCEISLMQPGSATLTPRPKAESKIDDPAGRSRDVLERTGIESAELYASYVPEGSSEWNAGLRAGDRIVSLDGVNQRTWRSMEDALKNGRDQMHTLVWSRLGEPESGHFQVRKEQWADDFGQVFERYVFRTTHWMPSAPDRTVPNRRLFSYALAHGWKETKRATEFVLASMRGLAAGRVSLSQVSGPITLYDVAGQAAKRGTSFFAWAMATTSVNLGLVNLLPIPILDGGHLLLFVIEGLRRKTVSLRTREIASLVGVVLLFALMLLAVKNDVSRKWASFEREASGPTSSTSQH